MNVFTIILCILALIFLIFTADFHLGRKHFLKRASKKEVRRLEGVLTLFDSGPDLFESMFNDIRHAKKCIHILFYIVGTDSFSAQFTDLLRKKAKEGLEVRLLLDRLGSIGFKESTIESLKESGVKFSFAHRPSLPYLFYSSQARNHRKITIIDSKIGYLGGYNVGLEYINKDSVLHPWRDYHLKLFGEGAIELEHTFLDDWERATGEKIQYHEWQPDSAAKGTQLYSLVPTEGAFLEQAYLQLIKQAKKSIIIGTPYFIPSGPLLKELGKALQSGVALTLIVPEKADHLLVKEASFKSLRKLLSLGARVFQYQKGFFHAKYIMIDDVLLDIGTANFDKRSLFLNFEINCYIYDPGCIRTMKGYIEEDLANSTELTVNSLASLGFWATVKEKAAHLLSPFL